MSTLKQSLVRAFLLLVVILPVANSFSLLKTSDHASLTQIQAEKTGNSAAEEAQRLLERSRALREEIALQESSRRKSSSGAINLVDGESFEFAAPVSKWSVPPAKDESNQGPEYRLYVDIGREEGTWMEPRWGASGKRIEFTLDVRFQPNQLADEETRKKMVQDNKGGVSSTVCRLETAPLARLRSGFDSMKCQGGAFRMDKSQKAGQSDTLRFFVEVEGTPERGSSYGDLFVPKGGLYFSIPCFGSVTQLSSKGEMPVTVRQMGWHTGWRREESRIVGIFRAVPIDDARRKDGF
jgi:hypothetical protein